jgi:hypothetical protein
MKMRPFIFIGLILASAAFAQEEIPHLGYVFPAGGQQGTTFRVTVGGQYLTGANAVRISGSGVTAEVIDYLRPLNQGTFKMIQKQMQELVAKKQDDPTSWTAADETRVADIRKKMATFYIRQSSAPALVETVILEVTVPRDAAPGKRELRLQTDLGLTNPLVFEIGQLPEYTEPSGRSIAVAESQNGARRRRPPEGTIKPIPGTVPVSRNSGIETPISLPATLNGQILPGDTDRYRFQACQGQCLTVDVKARRLIPYLSDAVPGWFQATVALLDSEGKELAYADDFQFRPDPMLRCEIPQDGDYVLEIRDALHRGREDFIYRVALGELPPVPQSFPAAGQDETGPNNDPANPQLLILPQHINGRIDAPGDIDVFRFDGCAGQALVAEVFARRLDSPLDSALKLTTADGEQVAFNDDHEDRGAGLTTHHADSRLSAILPKDGRYTLYLADEQQNGGPDFVYRLRIGAPQPDFDLRVVPSAINVHAGTTVPVTVHALRRDGLGDKINLSLENAPEGFILTGATIPAGQDAVQITLTVPENALIETRTLRFAGRSGSIIHEALPADDLMQAFIYRHLVPAEEQLVCVMTSQQSFAVEPLKAKALRLSPGGRAHLPINLPDSTSWGALELELSAPPAGISIETFTPGKQTGEIVFRCDAQTAEPGLEGNLIVNVYAMRDPDKMKGRGQSKKPRRLLTALPAIPYKISGGN